MLWPSCRGEEGALWGPEFYPTGATPRSLLAVDVDGAGPLELLTANASDGTVSVLRELKATESFDVGPGPRGMATGDLDGDRNLDLVVALADADAVQILLGTGDGSFRTGTRYPVGAAPYSLVVADFDGDASPEIATANALDDSVSVLWSGGRSTWPTAAQPGALVAVEDGAAVRLVVASETAAALQILDPRDGQVTSLAPSRVPRALAAGEDGGFYYAGSQHITSLSPAEGTLLKPAWSHPGARNTWVADVDGDGADELIVREWEGAPGMLQIGAASPDGKSRSKSIS
ncbi:VCBS repeat-containing protein [Nannocystis pusilla]|uniref:VCBS repeat-containing protein n=1 Tax=Nannocystis pusilla TaxID=889268 RepID=A0A9X3EZW1_9BACT|nr:VCBS repeat-containing protein [Nannocystis pusilla]MCY1012585.1 VCBS repeat-containing protein [Nannocystis pusilla]